MLDARGSSLGRVFKLRSLGLTVKTFWRRSRAELPSKRYLLILFDSNVASDLLGFKGGFPTGRFSVAGISVANLFLSKSVLKLDSMFGSTRPCDFVSFPSLNESSDLSVAPYVRFCSTFLLITEERLWKLAR